MPTDSEVDWALLIALYAGALSTALFIHKLWDNYPRIRVTHKHGVFGIPGTIGNLATFIEGTNIGKRPRTVEEYGYWIKKNKRIIFTIQQPDPLPKKLEDGDTVNLIIPYAILATVLRENGYNNNVKVRAYLRISTGKRYYSKSESISASFFEKALEDSK